MNNNSAALKKRIQRSRWRRFWRRGFGSIALVVVFCTTYMLILPAITITASCGLEEHTHIESCYDENGELTCERIAHVHNTECFPEEHAAEEKPTELDMEVPAAPETEAPVDETDMGESSQASAEEQDSETQLAGDSEAVEFPAEGSELSETVATEIPTEETTEESQKEYLIEDKNVTISLPNGEKGINASIMAIKKDSDEFNNLQNALTLKLGACERGMEMLYAYQVTLTDSEGKELTLKNSADSIDAAGDVGNVGVDSVGVNGVGSVDGVEVELTFKTPIESASEVSEWSFYSRHDSKDKFLKDITKEEKTKIAVNDGYSVISIRYNATGSGELLLAESSVESFDEEIVEEVQEESGVVTFTGNYEDTFVTATCERDVLPADATLTITPVEVNEEDVSAAMERERKRSGKQLLVENVYSFDLTFKNSDGKEIEPKGFVNVEMKFGSHLALAGDHLLFLHEKTPIEADISKVSENEVAALQFSVDSFSEFVLADSSVVDPDTVKDEDRTDWKGSFRTVTLEVLSHSTDSDNNNIFKYQLNFEAKYIATEYYSFTLPAEALDSSIQFEGTVLEPFFRPEGAIFTIDDKHEFHLAIKKQEDGSYFFRITLPASGVNWGGTEFSMTFWSTGDKDISSVLRGTAYAPELFARKIDANNEQFLPDAQYRVYYVTSTEPTVLVQHLIYTTDENGLITVVHNGSNQTNPPEGVKPGINLFNPDCAFFLQEVSAPVGYNIDPMRHWFYYIDTTENILNHLEDIDKFYDMVDDYENSIGGKKGTDYDVTRLLGYTDADDGQFYIAALKLVDTPGYTLPNTGGTGTNMYTYVGTLLICSAALILYKKDISFKRREMR